MEDSNAEVYDSEFREIQGVGGAVIRVRDRRYGVNRDAVRVERCGFRNNTSYGEGGGCIYVEDADFSRIQSLRITTQ